jgi:hypothetical protein
MDRDVPAGTIWVRLTTNRNRAFKQIANQGSAGANTALVRTTSDSFDVSTTTLGVNFGGSNPTTLGYIVECVVSNTTTGIWVNNCDDVRIQGINIAGWGANQAAPAYGIKLEANTYQRVVCLDCDSSYSGYHPIGTSCASTSGQGVFTIGRCRGWYAVPRTDIPGETMINLFSPGADSEFNVFDCDVPFASLPSDAYVAGTTTQGHGSAYFGHTSVGGATHALAMLVRCRAGSPGPYSVPDPVPLIANLPAATTNPSDYRGFVVDFRCTGFPEVTQTTLAADNTLLINPIIEIKPDYISNHRASLAGAGMVINGTIRVDASLQISPSGFPAQVSFWSRLKADAVTPNNPTIWHSHLAIENDVNTAGISDIDDSVNTLKIFNSVIANSGNPYAVTAFPSKVNTTNSSTYLGGNAYAGGWLVTGTGGMDADTSGVMLGGRSVPGVPAADSPLYGAAPALPGGYVLQFDQKWDRRPSSRASIGPLERYTRGARVNRIGLGL